MACPYIMANPWKSGFGYLLGRAISAQSALQVLAQAFFFDGVESDGLLKFTGRGTASVVTIPEDDLGLKSDAARIDEAITQQQDLPASVQVTYSDPALDYQQNKQEKRRNSRVVRTQSALVVEVPLAIDAETAMQIAEKTLYLAYLSRRPYQFNVWKATYMLLDPADAIQFVFNGMTFQARITKTNLGAGLAMAISGVSEDADNYISQAAGGGLEVIPGSGLGELVATELFLFDVPLLRDVDSNASGTGYYFAMRGVDSSPDWRGAVLYKSADDATFAGESNSNTQARVGLAVEGLAAPADVWAWDTVNELTATIAGSFATVTEAEILAGPVNALLVGNEVLQFRDALDNEDGTWTFSHLLRGRRGTDWAVDHAASPYVAEIVVALSAGGVKRVTSPLAVLDLLKYYRAVTVGQDLGSVVSSTFTIEGVDLKPYSPVGIGTVEQSPATDDLYITWFRRTRFGGALGSGDFALTDGMNGPLNEEAELYEVDIMDGASVVRTIQTTVATAIYTEAQQVEDFGSVQATYDIKVYQISAAVGRGTPGLQTIPAATDAPVVSAGGGGFYVN